MMTERAKQDRMYFIGKNLKRFGHTLACGAGFVTVGLLVPLSAPPIVAAALAFTFVGLEINNRLMRSYSDLLVVKLGRTIGQQFPLTFNREKKEKICEIIRNKGDNSRTNYISALMTAQIILFVDREKRRLSHKKGKEHKRADGTTMRDYRSKYKTCTHSVNVGTFLLLHEMGYIDIKSIEYRKKSDLHKEKNMIDMLVNGFIKTNIKKLFSSRSGSKEESKKVYDMFNIVFYLTDKQIDFEELINKTNGKNKTENDVNIDIKTSYTNRQEDKLPEEDKIVIVNKRIRDIEKSKKLSKFLIKDGLDMVGFDKNGISYSYVDKGNSKSIFQQYSDIIKHDNIAKNQPPKEHFNEDLEKTTMPLKENLNSKYVESREDR